MPELDTLPLLAVRARKIAALLALAHIEGIPTPSMIHISSYDALHDLEFSATPSEFRAWCNWLNADIRRDYPGSAFDAATATAHLEQWGPVTIRLACPKESAA